MRTGVEENALPRGMRPWIPLAIWVGEMAKWLLSRSRRDRLLRNTRLVILIILGDKLFQWKLRAMKDRKNNQKALDQVVECLCSGKPTWLFDPSQKFNLNKEGHTQQEVSSKVMPMPRPMWSKAVLFSPQQVEFPCRAEAKDQEIQRATATKKETVSMEMTTSPFWSSKG